MKTSAPLQKLALFCGIFSSVWYVFINIYVPTQYDGYSQSALTVSELSAIGAPTRQLWVMLIIPYPFLFAFFGWGVLQSSNQNKRLRVVGILILAYSAFNIYWPPMHMRGNTPTANRHVTHCVGSCDSSLYDNDDGNWGSSVREEI